VLGSRVLAANELFLGFLTTSLEPDELLVEIEVPATPAGSGSGFAEHARTHGDFALGGAAALVAGGEARLALLGAGPVPLRCDGAPEDLPDVAVADLSLTGPDGDWRRALLRELAREALARAQP
jgi:CO/xanthine dehydrogenase FAD-binding subunit